MNFPDVPIGVVSARSGVKVPTIRYYEQIGPEAAAGQEQPATV
jgi:hypothetical protein